MLSPKRKVDQISNYFRLFCYIYLDTSQSHPQLELSLHWFRLIQTCTPPNHHIRQQENIPVGYVPPACKPYVFQWLLLGVTSWGPQMNNFEQVSSDGHQMSLVGAGLGRGRGPMPDVWSGGGGWRSLYSEVQCVMGKGHQGSHSDWKTWINGKAFSSQGILNRLEKSGKCQGKLHKILENSGNLR